MVRTSPWFLGGDDLEHLLFLLIEFILWVDRRSLKPLNKVLPNLSELRPAGRRVGRGRRHHRTGAALGQCHRPGAPARLHPAAPGRAPAPGAGGFLVGRPLPRGALILLWAYLIAAPLLSVLFLLHRLKGAGLVLRSGAVEIHDRGSTIVCPWALFGAPGIPLQSAKDRVLLPVEPTAIPFVEVQRDDRLLAQGGRIRTAPCTSRRRTSPRCAALYQVELPEVAMLLLELGRQLAAPLPRTRPDHLAPLEVVEPLEMAPTLVRQADGWLKASLVHLTFPPYCCDCGIATTGAQGVSGSAHGHRRKQRQLSGERRLRQAGGSGVPFLPGGGGADRAKALSAGIGVGLLGGFVMAALICLLVGDSWLLLLALPLGILGILFGAVIGTSIGKSLASPVRLRGYAPEEGTLLLLFRNADYADALVEIHNGVSEEVLAESAASDDVYSER